MLTITPLAVLSNPDTTGRQVIAEGTIALTSNYGGASTHGDTCDLTQFGDALKTSNLPTKVEIWEDPASGTVPTFYQFVFCPGTTLKNGVVSIGSNLVEYTEASAYSAGLLAAALRIRVYAPAY